jgi:hypothetical protein
MLGIQPIDDGSEKPYVLPIQRTVTAQIRECAIG